MEWFKRNSAHFITGIRLLGAISLLFFEPLSIPFLIIYGVCGITDILDGIVARHYHIESLFGSALDSISDLSFEIVVAIKIFPIMIKLLPVACWVVIITATSLHIIAYIICAIKYHKFSAVHTYANKAMSVVIYFFPFSMIGDIYLLYSLYVYIGGVVAIYSSIEINLIHLISRRYDVKNKSVFLIRKNEQESL